MLLFCNLFHIVHILNFFAHCWGINCSGHFLYSTALYWYCLRVKWSLSRFYYLRLGDAWLQLLLIDFFYFLCLTLKLNIFLSRRGSVGVDTQLIFKNETVLPNSTSIEEDLKFAIVESTVFLGVIPNSITVGEFLILSRWFQVCITFLV